MLKERIDQDLKSAMLAGDKDLVTVLRGLKSAILYVEVAEGAREKGLSDEAVQAVLVKEAKKRQESVEMYRGAGEESRAAREEAEKAVIDGYLPEPLTDDELDKLVDDAIAEAGEASPKFMGQIISSVKTAAAGRADGGRIATLVKTRLK
jgi:uncharacterized protein YqeY